MSDHYRQRVEEYFAARDRAGVTWPRASHPEGVDLGARLRATRESRGLSYREAAEQLGTTASNVYKVENGSDPRWSLVQRIFAWLDHHLTTPTPTERESAEESDHG